MAKISYDGLWKLLIDKEMKKVEMKDYTGIGTTTLAKLSKNELVRMEILMRLCDKLHCNLSDIFEIYPDEVNENE